MVKKYEEHRTILLLQFITFMRVCVYVCIVCLCVYVTKARLVCFYYVVAILMKFNPHFADSTALNNWYSFSQVNLCISRNFYLCSKWNLYNRLAWLTYEFHIASPSIALLDNHIDDYELQLHTHHHSYSSFQDI